MTNACEAFKNSAIMHLRDIYLTRIEQALEVLPEADTWWRPHEGTTSVGNLLAHLAGNVRQWIVSGIGEARDHRDRHHEFQLDRTDHQADLVESVWEAVNDACVIIDKLTEAELAAEYTIQGFRVTGFDAVFHVVEHFSWHAGQITWITKLRAGANHDLTFSDDEELDAARNDDR